MGGPPAVLPQAESFPRDQQWSQRDPWEGAPTEMPPPLPLEPLMSYW